METVLGPLLQTVFDKLLSPLVKELESRGEYGKELKKLQELLPTIQAVIVDAEERQVRDQRVQIWLTKLRRVACDADDIFEEIQAIIERCKVDIHWADDPDPDPLCWRPTRRMLMKDKVRHQTRRMLMKCKVFFGAPQRFTAYWSNYRRIKEIRERLDDIVKEMNSFGFRHDVVYRRYETAERRQTGPYPDDSVVYGREEDLKTVVEMLLSGNDFVIPIVAMGVIGKTTLAQLAYNDPTVERNFNVRIWISVYDNFNVRKIINDILDYTSKGTRTRHDLSQLGLLQVQLQDSLQGNRYLIVLDDVWNEDQAEWEKLRIPLERCGSNGSKILVTTRSQSVASIMSTMPPYLLQPLTNEDCWALFKRHAFGEGEEQLFPSFVSISKEMVNMCGGVPLAAKILGSMMRSKRDKAEWLDVLRSSAEELGDSPIYHPISRALRLSYNHLPPHLKRCFSYLSVFPKKYELEKEKLIKQWIALGLVPSRTNANECFNDLMLMSFFHEITRYDDVGDGTTKFKLHDLIHDLAVSVAGDEVLRIIDSSSYMCDTSYARHASLECKFHSTRNKKALFSGRKLRTIHLLRVSPEGADDGQVIDQITSRQRWLRVLNLSGCGIESLHNSIGGLIILKYLDLSGTPIAKLPEAICGLFNLETLNLSGCNYLKELPRRITRLIKLRHLNIRDCASLTHMPPWIESLSRLETLSMFIIGRGYEHDLANIVPLNLGGELKIKCLENVEELHPGITYLANKKLHSLGLSWGIENEGKLDRRSSSRQTAERNPGRNEEYVLAILRPNLNLRRLSISGYAGTFFPLWMNQGILSDLTKLDLINCRRCENLPTLGKLPLLKVLKMKGMGDVVKISGEFYGNVELNQQPFFQSLIELNLEDFPELRAWESVDGAPVFPCLKRLTLTKCPRLSNMPRFPSLQHLELEDCNELILSSAAELNSLFTVVINKFPKLSFIHRALLQNNSRMTSLTLISCPSITSLPATLGNLTVLESLTIRFCEALVTLPDGLRNLTSLQTLEIAQCGNLTSLPEEGIEGLISLRLFSIENCKNLTCLPRAMKHLKALEHLTVMYCPILDLPDGLQHISTLRSLSMISCPELVSLPEGLQHVKMLQNLELRDCGKLVELPEWMENFVSLRTLAISECPNLKSLPKGFQNLIALQHLSIGDCPDLESRCQTERGEDWHKVSHIPHRYIGSSSLQQRQGGATSSSI